MKLNNTNTIMRRVLTAMITALAVVMVIAPAKGTVYAAGVDSLSDTEKNSSYGFFVWLSENADTAAEKADAKVAAQILTNTIPSSSSDVIFNNGQISAAHTLGVSYEQLLSQTALGAENDATSLECLRDAIHFVTQGNEYRAKENLAALKISSGLMAMAEVDVNYQGLNGAFGHSNIFASMENLAYLMLDGTWKYGIVGGSADEPYEGWYTEEKANYDSQNGGETGHYETLTDRKGTMYITGFAVRHRFTMESLKADDGKYYDCLMDRKYYSQHFSDNSTSFYYKGGTGVTPEKYEAYLDLYKCSVLGHTWDEGKVTTEPTCTEKGVTTYTCDVCGETKTEPIAAKGHKMSKTAAVAPKCTTGGNTEYYTCNVCGKYYSDSEGNTEIAKDSWVLPENGHSWETEYTPDKDSTCTEEGSQSFHCSVCDAVNEESITVIPMKKHSWTAWETTVEATEDQAGEEARHCTVCSEQETQVIPKLPHTHRLTHFTAVDADCTDQGNPEYWKCTKCERFYLDEECTEEINEEDTVIAALGHEEETVEGTPATCINEGLTDGVKCERCGEILLAQEKIDALGHEFENVEGTAVEPTCTEAGREADQKCSRCGDVKTGKAIEVLGHDYAEVEGSAVEPTCTEDGKEADQKCTRCGDVKTGETIEAAHKLTHVAATKATLSAAGNKAYYECAECGKMFSDAAGTKEISDPDSVVIPMLVNINKAQITGIAAKTYTGKALTQKPVVKVDGKTLAAGTNYSIAYKNNVKAGTASVVFSGKGAYGGTITKTFKINKANNTMAAAGRTATVKFSKLKKKNQTVKKASAFNVKKPVGKVTFKVATYDKKAKKKITVSAAGNVTVKKGLKKGTYKVKVKVTAAGTANYKASTKNVTLTIQVK